MALKKNVKQNVNNHVTWRRVTALFECDTQLEVFFAKKTLIFNWQTSTNPSAFLAPSLSLLYGRDVDCRHPVHETGLARGLMKYKKALNVFGFSGIEEVCCCCSSIIQSLPHCPCSSASGPRLHSAPLAWDPAAIQLGSTEDNMRYQLVFKLGQLVY